VRVVEALDRLGLFTEAGMAVLQRVWANAPVIDDATHWAVIEDMNRQVVEGLIGVDRPTEHDGEGLRRLSSSGGARSRALT
jgi:hypothetical protein